MQKSLDFYPERHLKMTEILIREAGEVSSKDYRGCVCVGQERPHNLPDTLSMRMP